MRTKLEKQRQYEADVRRVSRAYIEQLIMVCEDRKLGLLASGFDRRRVKSDYSDCMAGLAMVRHFLGI